jgi:NADPH:quinone reductase-like Zn-dependent oxidoreductase
VRAVRYAEYGGPDVLTVQEVAAPACGPGDVLVDVLAAGIGGGEVPIRAGRLRHVLRQRLPAGTGVEFVGVVAATGRDVTRTTPGDRVWGLVPRGTFGAVAEQVAVPQDRVARTPPGLEAVDAAALPAAGTTAVRALTRVGRLQEGQRLLVRGAAGGVGNLAVQYGHWLGARVTALAGARDLDWVRELGATTALDSRTTDPGRLEAHDLVVDLVGTELRRYRRGLAPGGTLVALALDPAHPIRSIATTALGGVGPRPLRTFSNDPTGDDLAELARLVTSGAVRPVVDAVYPMAQTAEAHRRLEAGGVRGKVVVVP